MDTFKIVLVAVVLMLCWSTLVPAQKLTVDEVIARNLESLGTPEARAAVKTFIAVGNGTSKYLSSPDLVANGRIVIASEGKKFFYGISLSSTSNRFGDEIYTFDGDVSGAALPRQGERTTLGNFVQSNKMLIDQGLLGGELSTSWLIANVAGNKGKISYAGIKKLDGKEMYVLEYSKKGGGDVDVSLYFDKASFRHVRTEYKRISSAGIGLRPEESSQLNETRFKIVEEFGDHRAEAGLMLPHTYRLVYSATGQRGTLEIEWKFELNEFAANQKFDPATFKAPGK